MFDPKLVTEFLQNILTCNDIETIESALAKDFPIIKSIIIDHPDIITSLHIKLECWNNITSFFHLMVYFNTPTSIKLIYLLNQHNYSLHTRYSINENGKTIEMDILAPYLRENPPASTTPFRQHVVNFLIGLGADLDNNNYMGVSSNWMLQQYRLGVQFIE